MINENADLTRLAATAVAAAHAAMLEAQAELAALRDTLSQLMTAKPVRAEYPNRDVWAVARHLHRAGTRDLRNVIRVGEQKLAEYQALLALASDIPRRALH